MPAATSQNVAALTAQGLEGLLAMMTEIRGQLQAQGKEITELRLNQAQVLGTLAQKVEQLSELLKDDPKGPLPTRIAVLEQQVLDLRAENDKLKTNRWTVWVAVASGLLGLLGSVAAAIISVALAK
jgi:hypothetical protein